MDDINTRRKSVKVESNFKSDNLVWPVSKNHQVNLKKVKECVIRAIDENDQYSADLRVDLVLQECVDFINLVLEE